MGAELAPPRGIVSAPTPDGRLEMRRAAPGPALAPFVHHVWLTRWSLRTPFAAEWLPHPSAQIIFKTIAGHTRVDMSGAQTGRVTRALTGDGTMFGLTFRPAMLQPLLRASMATMTDRVVPVAELLGARAEPWARTVDDASTVEDKMDACASLLMPSLALHPGAVRARDIVEHLQNTPSLVRVEAVCAVFAVDIRALQRAFRFYVGVGPKWVLERYRLLEAIAQLDGPTPPDLASLAASLGYADQAHFSRRFKSVVGRTPGSFGARSVVPKERSGDST